MSSANDPSLHSFVPIPPASHFPIQNLPFGVFRRADEDKPRVGVRIGDMVLDMKILEHAGLLDDCGLEGDHVFCKWGLNKFMSKGRPVWRRVREKISRLLSANDPTLRDNAELRAKALLPVENAQMCLPAEVGDYTDFYSSREHATNVGTMFRGKDNALQPNWLWLPVGYHGRSSSLVVSGTDIRRPYGQTTPPENAAEAGKPAAPGFGPSKALDFELEMGLFVGPGNELGSPVPLERTEDHIFGLVLVNDWSARDIQKWEYVPLGPFLGKNFGTSVSPWVVTLEALEPFRAAGPAQDPPPLPYLRGSAPARSTFDIHLEVLLQSAALDRPQRICATNFKHLYWSMAQQLAHHTVNGCNLRPGDLLASGTISGPTPDSFGSMLELAWGGTKPLKLSSGEERKYLQDGDRVIMTGWCENNDYRIGFGEVTGKILPARM